MTATRDVIVLKEFGKNLEQLRKIRYLSLRDLEAISEVDYSQIHRLEKGKSNPSLTVMLALANALECNINDLVPDKLLELIKK